MMRLRMILYLVAVLGLLVGSAAVYNGAMLDALSVGVLSLTAAQLAGIEE